MKFGKLSSQLLWFSRVEKCCLQEFLLQDGFKSNINITIHKEKIHFLTTNTNVGSNYYNLCLGVPRRSLQPTCLNVNVWKRTFQTSRPNRALPPSVWVIIRRFLHVAAIFTGRTLRIWWARLPNNKRQYVLVKVQERKETIMLGTALTGGLGFVYYVTHLVEDPITKRKKFIMFSEKQMQELSNIAVETELKKYKNKIFNSGRNYRRVKYIIRTIVDANKNVPGTKREWKILIVNDKDIVNAFVLPSGHIFVFSGIIELANNDDQLAAVLGHEMAHAILSHSAEKASKAHLLELILLLPIVALWSIFPDSVAMTSQYIIEYILNVIFHLPFSRKLETEADIVGLKLISRACFDPRQASEFWEKMDRLEREGMVEWLSTHPSSKTRYNTINELMPEAKKIFRQNCLKPDMNPRS